VHYSVTIARLPIPVPRANRRPGNAPPAHADPSVTGADLLIAGLLTSIFITPSGLSRMVRHNMISMLHVQRRAVALAAVLACAHAAAQDQVKWTFGGFGTLAAVHSTEKGGDYSASPISPGQAGRSKEWAFDVDSRIGAQLGVQFDRRWSAVVQVVHEKSIDGSFEPHLEWANVKFQATPELSLRAGRIALPLFLAADYRKASYALPWLRTPVELYSLMPISNSDGIDASYRWNAAGFKHETQVSIGRASVRMTRTVKGESNNVIGITHNATSGALTLRATLAHSKFEVHGGEQFFDAIRSFGPPGEALADRYDIARRNVRVAGLGFNYDPGNWFLMGEIGRVDTRSLLGDQTASYLSGGYRSGTVAPYATYARVRSNMAMQVAGLPVAGLPPRAAALATMLNGELNYRLRRIAAQDTASVGVRWDVAPNYAVKMQLDRVEPRQGSEGTLVNVRPGYRTGHAYGVVSVGVDFVF
jgi:Gram-negative porin